MAQQSPCRSVELALLDLVTVMGLIGDRKSKKQKEKEKEIEKLKSSAAKQASKTGKTGGMVGRYPAGYYTTPAPQSSWSRENLVHPGQPRSVPAVNPRYQTWVAPRKQQNNLNQLVSPAMGTVVESWRPGNKT